MSWAVQAQRAWHAQTAEEIAHSWVVGIVKRTSLGDLSGIALGWLGRQAPALVADLLEELNTPRTPPAPRPPAGEVPGTRALPDSAASCAGALIRLREPQSAAAEIPRDLAVLQTLLADAIGRNVGPEGDAEHRERSQRLVTLFGELNSEFTQALLADRLEREGRDAVTGLPGEREFNEELHRLVGIGIQDRTPFSVLELDLVGLRHVNVAGGRAAGDRLLHRVGEMAREQLGTGARVFRRSGDELAALLPGSAGPAALALANRMRQAIETLEGDEAAAPLAVGVASWPTHASDAAELLERVREATYLAKATGQGVAMAETKSPVS